MSFGYKAERLMRSLLARRRRAVQAIPPVEEILRGTVLVREVRCGKAACRCASGDRHRVTYLSVTLANGRTEQISLPATLAPLARRWVANYRRWWQIVEKVSAINRQILRRRRSVESQGKQGTRQDDAARAPTPRRRRPR